MSLYRIVLLTAFCLCAAALFCNEALARPEMASKFAKERFAAMDEDKDGKVSREEFFKAQPDMKEAAFEAIDRDKDGFVSAEEWEGFAAGHGGMPPEGQGGAMPPHGQDGAMPPHGQDGAMPPHGQDGAMPPHGQDGAMPPHGQDGAMPPHGQGGAMPPHGQDGGKDAKAPDLIMPPKDAN